MRALLKAFSVIILFVTAAAADLPQRFSGWESKNAQTISTPQLGSAAGNDAAVYREYGFLGAERREYSKGGAKLTVTLWRMQDATGSYGLLTYLSQPGMTATKNGEDITVSGPSLALIQRGPYLLEAMGEGLAPADISTLSGGIPSVKGRESLPPPLPGFLPEQGIVPQSARFIIGPAAFGRVVEEIPAREIGFDTGAEAAVANYRAGDRDAQLLLVSYATPQLAGKKLKDFQALPALSKTDNGKTLFIERKGSLIAFVMGAKDLAATEKLLAQIPYESDITWNEYVPPRKENAGKFMMAIFSLAGFLLLFSFVAGIAFGGVRLLAKRFIPIPVFDRPSQLEIIQLKIADR
jgi:hypothetical protein